MKRSLQLAVILSYSLLGTLASALALAQAATRTAKSCSQQDVQAAIDAAQDGDTVVVPAGTSEYKMVAQGVHALAVKNKGIALIGAGIGRTILKDNTFDPKNPWSGGLLHAEGPAGKALRISGFTFDGTGIKDAGKPAIININGSYAELRIDHCQFLNVNGAIKTDGLMRGLVDHCRYELMEDHALGNPVFCWMKGNGAAAWKTPVRLGSADAIYIEDCHIEFHNPKSNDSPALPTMDGARAVFRHNTVYDGFLEFFGVDSTPRGTASFEVYGNTFTGKCFCAIGLKGGTGVVFNNTIRGDFQKQPIWATEHRAGGPRQSYPAMDQIGRGRDAGADAVQPQPLEPVYAWNNKYNGEPCELKVRRFYPREEEYIQEGRDFFNAPKPGYTPLPYPHPAVKGESPIFADAKTGTVPDPAVAAPAAGGPPTQREIVKRAMHQRGDDPWPRGAGHVLLAIPGSQQPEKGYHEPGGSFSPAVGSFGVSIWVRDSAGNLKATSDGLPMEQIRQRFCWPDPKGVPAINTVTPHYEATWACTGIGSATLDLQERGDSGERLELVIRSVGPAGGPIERIEWDGKRLRINDRWTVSAEPEPKAVFVGHEGDPGWKTERTAARQWRGEDGWGYARMELAGGATRLTISSAPSPPAPLRAPTEGWSGEKGVIASPLSYPAVRSMLTLDLPDQRFVDCLNAQVAHLMMGLLDRRTPPGDPTNYPLAWQRDGVATVAGLMRAGQVEVAKELCKYFAENDFFGGFGAEGDAPGQGLRTMEDVAVRVQDPALDRWLWPHACRKAELILQMASTEKRMRMPYVGPIVPEHRKRNDLDLLCDPARNGLIIGRMDFGRPASYITAVSCQGLRAAAALARRLKHPKEAERWLAAAEGLQKAWLAAPQWKEPRTYISGLWPTWVAAPEKAAYREQLERHSDPRSYLPWTYFSAAMTHQWLFLDQPERVWQNFEWFCGAQTSPGLYTWWEGTHEENTFHLWENVRGWVSPPHVTPHYWTAGEMLALEVDMLAYVDESGSEPVLVIGGGVPKAWVGKPLRVAGLPTSAGLVDWSWREGKMHVTVHGRRPKLRLGAAFGAAEPVESAIGDASR
jgi:hypothetical protein